MKTTCKLLIIYGLVLYLLCKGCLHAETEKSDLKESAKNWGDLKIQFEYSAESLKALKARMKEEESRIYSRHVSRQIYFWLVPEKDQSVPIFSTLQKKTKEKNVTLSISKKQGWDPTALIIVDGQTLVVRNLDKGDPHVGIHEIAEEITKNNIAQLAANPQPILMPQRETVLKHFHSTFIPVVFYSGRRLEKNMDMTLLVSPTPYAILTDSQGTINLKNLPVGTWTFHAWCPRFGNVRNVLINGQKTHWEKGRVKINIKPGQNDLGKVVIFDK